jgi:hypothetical protein
LSFLKKLNFANRHICKILVCAAIVCFMKLLGTTALV